MDDVSRNRPLVTLRQYQEECVRLALAACEQDPHGHGLLVLPTGCGKTVVFAEIARRLNVTTLVIAHREELLRQAAEKFRLLAPGLVVGQVGAGRHEWGAQVTIASVQTVSRPRHLARLRTFDYRLVVIDECHHGTAAGYRDVLEALPLAFTLGVTATPDRLDGARITDVFGQPLFEASMLEMVRQGFLCDLRAIAVRTDTSLDDLRTQAGDFKQDELEERVDTPERNDRVVEAFWQHARGRLTLCFAVTVEHAFHLAEAFQARGVTAAVVCGETPQEERQRILRDYERGMIEVLCNVGVLTEGYDAPQTSCIILARPTQSRALFTQCVGRGTRLAPGKRDCLVLDITDNCLKHYLQPMTLGLALEQEMRDGESLTEAIARVTAEDEEEQAGQSSRERIAHVTRRASDLPVDLLGELHWRRASDGSYRLQVGAHTIGLFPVADMPGSYAVWARLAPSMRSQCWLAHASLDWAQQVAEANARLLLEDEEKLVLVDVNAPWRSAPASSRQLDALRKLGIPHEPAITRGAASDLIQQFNARCTSQKRRKQA